MILKSHVRVCFLLVPFSLSFLACAPKPSQSTPTSSRSFTSIDPQNLIPTAMRVQALDYYQAHKSEVAHQNEMTIVQISTTRPEKIFYHVDMVTGEVSASKEPPSDDASNDSLIYTYLDSDFATPESRNSASDHSVGVAFQPNSTLSEAVPLWESARPEEGSDWSQFTAETLQSAAPHLLAGSKDIASFCPHYTNLSNRQKTEFWVYLISAVAQYESGFQPTSRFREAGMGQDPITGQHVYSEGLLQLSYQDRNPYPFCNEFLWPVDRSLATTDPRKTIFDPHKNLRCGVRIFNQIVGNSGLISFSGHYWSTLRPRNSSKRAIQALTNKLSICAH